MKLFPVKKKDEEEEKKKKLAFIADKLEEKTPSRDSDTAKKSPFGGMFNPLSKGKQEPAKSRAVTTDVKPADRNNPETLLEAERLTVDQLEQQQRSQGLTVQAGEMAAITDKDVRKLIEAVSLSKENAIIPSLSFDESRISYPLLAEAGEDEYNTALLERLASPSVNILEKDIYERLAACPEHPELLAAGIRIYCPNCSSMDTVKLHLIEHKLCGYIAEKNDFTAAGDNRCPSCNNVIKNPEKELRKPGMWYLCNKCETKFDNPIIKLHCRKFNHDFDINAAEMVSIPYYKLKEDVKTVDYNIFSLMPQLKKLLITHGFAVEESSAVKGKSGVAHTSSIYAYNNVNKTILIDVKGSETSIDDTDVIATFVKVLDISPTIAIFIGIPSVSDKAKAMAVVHNISIVTGKNFQEILTKIDQILSKDISAPTSTINKIE